MCTIFGWLIRVNAEAMLLRSQKTCSKTEIVKFSRFIFYHKGQLWQDSIPRLLHISTRFFFVIKIHIVYLKTVPGLFDTTLRGFSILRRKWKHRKKDIFYIKYEIFPKIKLQLANTDTVFGRRHVCIILSKSKIEKGSIVSELNPELRKTGVLPQTLQQSHRVLNHKFLQPAIDLRCLSTQQKKEKVNVCF